MTRTTASVCAALLVIATGCGGDGGQADRYMERVDDAQTALSQTFTGLAARITGEDGAEADAGVLREYEAAVARAVAALRAAEPPDDVVALHERLITRTASLGNAVAKARAVFQGQDARKIIAAQTELNSAIATATDDVNELTAEINDRLHE